MTRFGRCDRSRVGYPLPNPRRDREYDRLPQSRVTPLRQGTPEGDDLMTARTGAGARRPGTRCLDSRRHRHRRRIGPLVEALERRLALAGTSPTNPVPIGPQADATPNPHALGAAYQRIVAVQTTTLQSLGDVYREVQAAGARFASRAAVAIDGLKAELGQSQSQHDAHR